MNTNWKPQCYGMLHKFTSTFIIHSYQRYIFSDKDTSLYKKENIYSTRVHKLSNRISSRIPSPNSSYMENHVPISKREILHAYFNFSFVISGLKTKVDKIL